MTTPSDCPRIAGYKAQAKRLRTCLLETNGTALSHSEALELVARQHGARDWNTLRARNSPPDPANLSVGSTVRGRYLRQPFTGHVHGLVQLGGGRCRITLQFDAPVDVVTFDSFSAFRRRVTCIVGSDGTSPAKTSNGSPHLVLDAVE